MLLQDVRFGCRMLYKNAGFTIIATLVLALGIGGAAAIFSIVDAVILRALPYSDPERLVWVWEKTPDGYRNNVAAANFLDWRDQNSVFEGICATAAERYILSGVDQPEQFAGSSVSANFFDLLGATPFLGRTFLPEDEEPGREKVVVVSHGVWQRRFGSNQDLVGRDITLNGETYTVIGIMPPRFQFRARRYQMWTPLALDRATAARDMHYLKVIARLRSEVTFERALAELETLTAHMSQYYPERKKEWSATLQPLQDWLVRPRLRQSVLVLFGAVGFILLIACVNVSNLLLARSASRHKEVAVRCSLGAGRLRLIRQLLTESLLLSSMGGVLAMAMASGFVRTFPSIFPAVRLPATATLEVDSRVLLFTLAVALATIIFFGLAPAWQASRAHPIDALKEGGRTGSGSRRGHRFRRALVATEVALALVLLVGASLMMKSLVAINDIDPGVRTQKVLTMDLSLPETKYPDAPSIIRFFRESLERIEALPGVQSAGISTTLPLQGSRLALETDVAGSTDSGADANVQRVSPGYFHAMGLELLRGRWLNDGDHESTARVAVVNETFVERHFQDGDVLQKEFTMQQLLPRKKELGARESWRIVGVVKDVKVYGLLSDPVAEVYITYLQSVPTTAALAIHTATAPEDLIKSVQAAILTVDKDLPPTQVATMESVLAQAVSQPEFRSHLLGLFASVAVILASLGIYGVTAYFVSERTHEIGIRLALGAEHKEIIWSVLRRSLATVMVGIGLGIVAASWLTKFISSLLYGVSPTDPRIFCLVAAILAGVAALASYIPARRASRVDPVVSLRHE
jgi:putative ABC transport system permease protein